MDRKQQGFKFKIIIKRDSVWGKVLYASTLHTASTMAAYYGGGKIYKL